MKTRVVLFLNPHRPAAKGTAREVVQLILKSQGRWEQAVPLAQAQAK